MSTSIDPSTSAAPAGSARVVTRTVVVGAEPSTVFALLADPSRHPELDGSGTVKALLDGPDRLTLDAEFSMKMGGYTTHNRVVEFVDGRVIAWRHRARHVWRYQLQALPGGRTQVTEEFDWSAKRAPRLVAAIGIPRRADKALESTLSGLADRWPC